MCARFLKPKPLAEDCNHDDAEPFGSAGSGRCNTCGKTLVSSAVRAVVVPVAHVPIMSLR